MGKVISIINNKGGCSKTTTTFNLGYELANMGKEVLIIDLDQQASLSVYVGLDPLQEYANITDVFKGNMSIEDVIVPMGTPNLELIPSNIEFSKIEMFLLNKKNKINVLKNLLKSIKKQYDYILLDNAPSLNTVSLNSLMASDLVIAPVDASYVSVRAMEILEKTVEDIKEYNKNLQDIKVLITMYTTNTLHSKEVAKMLREKYYVFPKYVHTSVKFKNAVQEIKSIRQYAGDNFIGTQAYEALAQEVEIW